MRSPQNFAKSSPYIWPLLHRTTLRWRFHKNLWPSQNIWTLLTFCKIININTIYNHCATTTKRIPIYGRFSCYNFSLSIFCPLVKFNNQGKIPISFSCFQLTNILFFSDPIVSTTEAHEKNLHLLKSYTKGQLISEFPFIFFNFPKNQRNIWQISAPESKKWSNQKIKAPYSVYDMLNSPYNHSIIRKCLYFVDLTTF